MFFHQAVTRDMPIVPASPTANLVLAVLHSVAQSKTLGADGLG
jgi:hypothetical protein